MAVGNTAVWRVRPSGNNSNGGGYDASISGAGTDYSQQNSAQATGTHGTASASTTFTDSTANAFTSAMIGNCLKINSGSGFTTGLYFITGYTSASTVTLDRSPGTGTVANWRVGGAWADPRTNTTAGIVPGNIIYILGSGIPNPASYTYDYTLTSNATPVAGDVTNGMIRWMADPNTPNYSTGGMPVIKGDGLTFYNGAYGWFERLWFVCSNNNNSSFGFINSDSGVIKDCGFDQFGYDMPLCQSPCQIIGCEITSTVAKRSTNTNAAIQQASFNQLIWGNNIHDVLGDAIQTSNQMGTIAFNLITKCGGNGITRSGGQQHYNCNIFNNTFDNNLGHGISIGDQTTLSVTSLFNNIFANHTGSGKYAIIVGAGTAAQNDRIKQFCDWNTFYGNTNDTNTIDHSANDTTGISDPFNNEASNDYTLVSGRYNAGVYPPGAILQLATGWNG